MTPTAWNNTVLHVVEALLENEVPPPELFQVLSDVMAATERVEYDDGKPIVRIIRSPMGVTLKVYGIYFVG